MDDDYPNGKIKARVEKASESQKSTYLSKKNFIFIFNKLIDKLWVVRLDEGLLSSSTFLILI
jgi:hypothetical protein